MPQRRRLRGAAASGWNSSSLIGGVEPGNPEFHFDNETPRQRVWLEACALADRLVTNAEFEAFIADGDCAGHSSGWPRAGAWYKKSAGQHPATGARMGWNSACAACNRGKQKPLCDI